MAFTASHFVEHFPNFAQYDVIRIGQIGSRVDRELRSDIAEADRDYLIELRVAHELLVQEKQNEQVGDLVAAKVGDVQDSFASRVSNSQSQVVRELNRTVYGSEYLNFLRQLVVFAG